MAGAETGARRYSTRRRGNGFAVLIAILLAGIGIVICMNLFFHVEYIKIEGLTKYAPQEIVENCGVYQGDKLFRVDADAVSERLTSQYAYIEKVKVRHRLPSTLVLDITQSVPAACYEGEDGKYCLINRSGRLLEDGMDTAPSGIILVDGLGRMPSKKEAGKDEDYDALLESYNDCLNAYNTVVDGIEASGISGVSYIDMTDRYAITFLYRSRVAVLLQNELDVEYKLEMVCRVIADEVGATGEYFINASEAGVASVRPVSDIGEFFHSGRYSEPETEETELFPEEEMMEGEGEISDGKEEEAEDVR